MDSVYPMSVLCSVRCGLVVLATVTGRWVSSTRLITCNFYVTILTNAFTLTPFHRRTLPFSLSSVACCPLPFPLSSVACCPLSSVACCSLSSAACCPLPFPFPLSSVACCPASEVSPATTDGQSGVECTVRRAHCASVRSALPAAA